MWSRDSEQRIQFHSKQAELLKTSSVIQAKLYTHDCVWAGRRVMLHTRYFRFIVPQWVISTFKPSRTQMSLTVTTRWYFIYQCSSNFVYQDTKILFQRGVTMNICFIFPNKFIIYNFMCSSTSSSAMAERPREARYFFINIQRYSQNHAQNCTIWGNHGQYMCFIWNF